MEVLGAIWTVPENRSYKCSPLLFSSAVSFALFFRIVMIVGVCVCSSILASATAAKTSRKPGTATVVQCGVNLLIGILASRV